MKRRQKRHPVLETAVFAAALLLAAFIGRELWRRRAAPPAPVEPTASVPAVLNPTFPPLPVETPRRRTEMGVSAVPSLKLTRVQRRRPKTAVPAPK